MLRTAFCSKHAYDESRTLSCWKMCRAWRFPFKAQGFQNRFNKWWGGGGAQCCLWRTSYKLHNTRLHTDFTNLSQAAAPKRLHVWATRWCCLNCLKVTPFNPQNKKSLLTWSFQRQSKNMLPDTTTWLHRVSLWPGVTFAFDFAVVLGIFLTVRLSILLSNNQRTLRYITSTRTHTHTHTHTPHTRTHTHTHTHTRRTNADTVNKTSEEPWCCRLKLQKGTALLTH